MRILTIFFPSINKETYGMKNSALAAVSKNNVLLFHWCMYSFSNQSCKFLLIKWRHHYHRRDSNFDQYSAPHLMWHGSSVYNGHLQGPVTPACTFCRALGSGAVTTCFKDLQIKPQSLACEANALSLSHHNDLVNCNRWWSCLWHLWKDQAAKLDSIYTDLDTTL